jgi:enoyl-[acyl-carrier protein] reductase I
LVLAACLLEFATEGCAALQSLTCHKNQGANAPHTERGKSAEGSTVIFGGSLKEENCPTVGTFFWMPLSRLASGLVAIMLAGKRALVLGVANARSLAWHIASRWRAEGAQVFVTYQDDRFKDTVAGLIRNEWGPISAEFPLPASACDVSRDAELEALFALLERRNFCSASQSPGAPKLDAVLHSIAHASADAMKDGTLLGTTREAFVEAHAVSSYSLIAASRCAVPYLAPAASITAMTYIGSKKVVPNYNIMGPAKASLESCARALAYELGDQNVRVNCLSPGPVRTLAAKGIKGFNDMAKMASERAPMQRAADMSEITGAATFLASNYSSAITGQTLYVDCGFSSVI